MTRDCYRAAVGMPETSMAPYGADVHEPIDFECADVAAGDPSRDLQTVTSTAGDSADAISA